MTHNELPVANGHYMGPSTNQAVPHGMSGVNLDPGLSSVEGGGALRRSNADAGLAGPTMWPSNWPGSPTPASVLPQGQAHRLSEDLSVDDWSIESRNANHRGFGWRRGGVGRGRGIGSSGRGSRSDRRFRDFDADEDDYSDDIDDDDDDDDEETSVPGFVFDRAGDAGDEVADAEGVANGSGDGTGVANEEVGEKVGEPGVEGSREGDGENGKEGKGDGMSSGISTALASSIALDCNPRKVPVACSPGEAIVGGCSGDDVGGGDACEPCLDDPDHSRSGLAREARTPCRARGTPPKVSNGHHRGASLAAGEVSAIAAAASAADCAEDGVPDRKRRPRGESWPLNMSRPIESGGQAGARVPPDHARKFEAFPEESRRRDWRRGGWDGGAGNGAGRDRRRARSGAKREIYDLWLYIQMQYCSHNNLQYFLEENPDRQAKTRVDMPQVRRFACCGRFGVCTPSRRWGLGGADCPCVPFLVLFLGPIDASVLLVCPNQSDLTPLGLIGLSTVTGRSSSWDRTSWIARRIV